MLFDLTECEQTLGYVFGDKNLLRRCFTFKSYANEHFGAQDNERLEYLGDAVLGFIVAEYLYKTYPNDDEGELTKKRIKLVSKEPLQESVKKYGFDKFMLVGAGTKRDLHGNEKIFSSLFECIVAGIYLDGGAEKARRFVLSKLIADGGNAGVKKDNRVKKITAEKDPKSALQEYVQKYKLGSIEYVDKGKDGPDHEPTFFVGCYIDGKETGRGKGHNKKTAQAEAAKTAYAKIIGKHTRGNELEF